jgi:hypothetical protein
MSITEDEYQSMVEYYKGQLEDFYGLCLEAGLSHFHDSDFYAYLGMQYPDGKLDRIHIIKEHTDKPSNVVSLEEFRKKRQNPG